MMHSRTENDIEDSFNDSIPRIHEAFNDVKAVNGENKLKSQNTRSLIKDLLLKEDDH